MIVNGKEYPMWSQFVEKKDQFIGRKLEDFQDGMNAVTVITDIRLEPNGPESAAFYIDGEDFTCGFDVYYGGITAGDKGWLTFSGYGDHIFRIESGP